MRLRARVVRSSTLALVAAATWAAAFAAPSAWAATPGAVAGLVREAVTEAPIAKIEVCALATAEPLAPKACATTAATGEYEIAGLAEGQYQVSFLAPAKSGLNYLTQYFDARSAEALADPVTVTGATTTQNVNATMQPGGEIKGLVKDDKGNLLAGIEACALEKGMAAPARCVSTKASGKYVIAGLASGEYEIEFSSPAGSKPDYVTQFYEEVSSRSAAKPVAVTAGAPAVEGVNAVLEATGAITGTVSSATTSAPLANVEVCAFSVPGRLETCTSTDANGAYTLPALTQGDYHVEFIPSEGSEGYESQWYKERSAEAEAEIVTVAAGATTGAIDARLQPLPPPIGTIGGTVTSAATKGPLPGVEVCAHLLATEIKSCTVTDATGSYTLAALPTGSYIVSFLPAAGGSSYAPQYFNGKTSEAEAEAVPVAAGAIVTGIDAVLQGIPVAVLRPAIAGHPVEGQTLTLVPGTWTNSPVLADEWGQCDATGAIESCHTIATTPTYTPTAADVGCTIRVRERASNAFGAGTPAYLFSPPTAPVTTASGATGTCRPVAPAAPTWSPPAATSAVSAATTASASSAQLKALLAKLLVPSGKGAKIAALRRRGRYVFTFSSLIAGRLSIAWYLVPKGTRVSVARAKPVLVGSGKLTTNASGPAKLTIKLTAAGRALLARGKPLKLTAKGAFAPKGRPTLTATRSFTLKR